MSQADISTIDTLNAGDLQAIRALLVQLSSDAKQISQSNLEEIVSGSSTTMFVARIDRRIIGMTTLAMFRVTTGMRAFIDDVVVLEEYRNRRLGEKLVRSAIQHAHSCNADHIDLTSRSFRESANRLYKKLGFQRRETNVYRLVL